MKKIIFILFSVFLLTGCNMGKEFTNTPTKRVETFFNKYQTLDKTVLDDLDKVIAEEDGFNGDQRIAYRDLMKKNYQKLRYDVKEERVDGDHATVTVEIEVVDYSSALREADRYLDEHRDEFNDKDGKYDVIKYNDYRLKLLKESKEPVKYTLELHLTKKNDEWKMDELSGADEDKIHGIYSH